MTGAEFREWRYRCSLTAPVAAKILGVSLRTIYYWQRAMELPRTTSLAVAAVDASICSDMKQRFFVC